MKRTLAWLAAALAVLSTGAVPAKAFSIVSHGRLLSMELAGHAISVPGPLWGATGEAVATEKSQVIYHEDAAGQSVLLLPVEETLVTWTEIMGVSAASGPSQTAAGAAAALVASIDRDCVAGQARISTAAPVKAGGPPALLLLCGRFRPDAARVRHCAAGMAVAVVLESRKGVLTADRQWCTQSFGVDDPDAWPIKAIALEQRAWELQVATTFSPVDAAPLEPGPAVDAGAARP
jgi:hypothetical protein